MADGVLYIRPIFGYEILLETAPNRAHSRHVRILAAYALSTAQ